MRRRGSPTQLTIRGFDPEVAEAVRDLARRERLSLNQAVMALLRRATGRTGQGPASSIGRSLDDLAGTWTEGEAREFALAIESLEQINAALWRPPTRTRRRR